MLFEGSFIDLNSYLDYSFGVVKFCTHFSVMEIEGNKAATEPSATPELDADLPKKGIPRLVIEKLVLENFKSYAGVKVGCA